MEYGKKTGLIWKHAKWRMASGEITIHPYRKQFLEIVRDCNVDFYTNAFIFDEDIGRILHDNPNARLSVSIDSGTAKTWKSVKGFDNFEKIKSNLRNYSSRCFDGARCQLALKYIILPGINDNNEDYENLVKFMDEIGAKTLEVSRDSRIKYVVNDEKSRELIDSAARLQKYCDDGNIETSLDHFFTPLEQEKIKLVSKSI